MTDDAKRAGNGERLRAFLAAVGEADFDTLSEVCTEDFVAELPYSDPPRHLESFAAYREAIAPALEIYRFRLSLKAIHPGLDPDFLIAEYTSDGIAVPTGKPYRNVYIGLYRFREGRICGLREFYNPEVATRALAED